MSTMNTSLMSTILDDEEELMPIDDFEEGTDIESEVEEEVEVPQEVQQFPIETLILQSSSSAKKESYQWVDADTKLFITFLIRYKAKLENSKYKKKDIFGSISKEMDRTSNKKYQPTPIQCDNRYKSLLRKFKEIKDHNNKSGNDLKSWKYFDQMEEFVGVKSNITPVASCSSLDLQKSEKRNVTNLKEILASQKQNKRKIDRTDENKPKRPRSGLIEFMKSCEEKIEAREKKRLELQTQQHEDFKVFMSKLLEKL